MDQKIGLKIKSIAIAAMDENDELAGAMDLLQELMLKPNGEAQEIVKTYNVALPQPRVPIMGVLMISRSVTGTTHLHLRFMVKIINIPKAVLMW